MDTPPGYIDINGNKLHYLRSGTGKQLLLAFHGYGNDATLFHLFDPYLTDVYTILSIDLPFHGQSKWPDDTPLTKADLVTLVTAAMAICHTSKVSLLGYSLGGRICLSIIEAMPASIGKVVLMATDGLVPNAYYSFFTRNYFGKKIFRNMLTKPAPYFKLMALVKNLGCVHPSRYKFAERSLESEAKRRLLLQVWPCLSLLIPRIKKIKAEIRKYHIPVYIFMGAHDKIMPPSLAVKFGTGLDTVQVLVSERGHQLFDNENVAQIAGYLL